VVLVKGDEVSLDLADVVIAVSRAKSVTGIEYLVFIVILLFLESVLFRLFLRSGNI
jgi:hypothetical protein